MPILDISVVLGRDEVLAPGLARSLADAAAGVLAVEAGRVWVTLTALPPQAYAENGVSEPDTPKPVFVRVLKACVEEPVALAPEAAALAHALAPLLAREPDLIHLVYEPAASGRIAFGGRLRET